MPDGAATTAERKASTVVRLDRAVESAAFRADPDVALGGLKELVLLDEWQAVPEVFAAARRAIDRDPSPDRFYLTGSVAAEHRFEVYPGTGRIQRLAMYPMTVRESEGLVEGDTFLDRVAGGRPTSLPADVPDLRGYIDLALTSGYPVPATRLSGRSRETWVTRGRGSINSTRRSRLPRSRACGADGHGWFRTSDLSRVKRALSR